MISNFFKTEKKDLEGVVRNPEDEESVSTPTEVDQNESVQDQYKRMINYDYGCVTHGNPNVMRCKDKYNPLQLFLTPASLSSEEERKQYEHARFLMTHGRNEKAEGILRELGTKSTQSLTQGHDIFVRYIYQIAGDACEVKTLYQRIRELEEETGVSPDLDVDYRDKALRVIFYQGDVTGLTSMLQRHDLDRVPFNNDGEFIQQSYRNVVIKNLGTLQGVIAKLQCLMSYTDVEPNFPEEFYEGITVSGIDTKDLIERLRSLRKIDITKSKSEKIIK